MANESNQGRAGLAQALAAPLEAGDIEAALSVARRVQMRAPGDEEPRRIVEALELLMSQVWYGGQEGAAPAGDSAFARAAKALEAGDLRGALAEYRSPSARADNPERADNLAHRVEIVIAAAEGRALPVKRKTNPRRPAAPRPDEVPTRVGAKKADSVEVPVIEDLADEVADEPLLKTIQDVSESVDLSSAEIISDVPPAPSPLGETTRVAKNGELPLEELRRQMAREDSDAQLDGLLDELESEEVEIDIDVEVDLGDDGLGQPVPRTPSRTFRRPSAEELEDDDEEEPTSPRLFDAPPMPGGRRPSSPPIPSREQLVQDDAHMAEHPPYSETEEATTARLDPTTSWTGVPIYEQEPATFEPSEVTGEVTLEEDSWSAPAATTSSSEERQAERLVGAGDLEQALKIYERLAAKQPDNARLWRRIKAIAWMLRRDVDPTET